MSEYISREAATKALCNSVPHSCDFDTCDRLCQGVAALDSVPAADVRPVVQCKDCKHAEPWYRDRLLCFLWNEDAGNGVFESGFCSYGERKGES